MEKSPGATVILSTGSLFHLPLKTIARLAQQAGFCGLELIVNGPKIKPGDTLMEVDAICPIRSLHAPFRDWDKWGGHLNSWQATTKIANSLPVCDHVTLHPPGTGLTTMIQHRWFSKAHDLPLLLDAKGRVNFSLENLPWVQGSPFGRDPLDKLIDQCREKNVGLTYDVCHMGVSGRNVLAAMDSIPGDLLFNVHYSDAKGFQEHLTPGKGDLPLKNFLGILTEREYAGYVTLELEPAAFPDDLDGTVEELQRLRHEMETWLGQA